MALQYAGTPEARPPAPARRGRASHGFTRAAGSGRAEGCDGREEDDYALRGGRYSGAGEIATSFGTQRLPNASQPGLTFVRNRFYDQQTGRWTQEGPIGVVGCMNLDGFVGNNPATFTDPFGLSPWGKLIKLGVRGFKTVAKRLDFDEMVDAVRQGDDVLAPNRRTAREVAQAAGDGRRPVGPEVHRPETGNRPHYHTSERSGGHVFYSVAPLLTASHYAKDRGTLVKDAAEVEDFFNPLAVLQDAIGIKGMLSGTDDD